MLLRQANDTIESLLNMINRKTAYTWSYNNNTIIFTANKAVKVVDSFIINSNESKSESNIVDKNDTIESTKLANNLKERLVPQQWVLDPSDKTIREALNKWSKLANWQLIWNVSADYPIVTRWVINADFENAVNEVLRASSVTNVPLMANMYDNNHVLEIYSNNNYEK